MATESVLKRIERAASLLPGAPPADENETLIAFNALSSNGIEPFLRSCEGQDVTKAIGIDAAAAFGHMQIAIQAIGKCKKPADDVFMKFLEPIVQVVGKYSDPKRGNAFNYEKAFGEMIQCANWFFVPGTKKCVEESYLQAEFYNNKVLIDAKKEADEAKQVVMRSYVSSMKVLVSELANFVGTFYGQGVVWNAKGSELAEFKAGGAESGSNSASAGRAATEVAADVLSRLEVLALRLETAAAALAPKDSNEKVAAYEAYLSSSAKAFIDACNAVAGTKTIGTDALEAWNNVLRVVRASCESKKPSDESFFQSPPIQTIGQIISKYENPKRGPFFNHEKAFGELVQCHNWVCIPGKATVTNAGDQAQMYLNKILMEAKKEEDSDKQSKLRAFVSSTKALIADLAAFVETYYKMGLEWNVKGTDLSWS